MASYASKAYYYSKKATLEKELKNIITNETAMSVICDFLNEPYSCNAEARYDSSIGFLRFFIDSFDLSNYPANVLIRIVATLPDGTVWYDSSKTNNTYQHFLNKCINENHNTRPAFLQALMSDCGFGFETKPSSTTAVNYQARSAARLGSCQDNALGVISFSLSFCVVNNVTGPPDGCPDNDCYVDPCQPEPTPCPPQPPCAPKEISPQFGPNHRCHARCGCKKL